MASQGLRLYTRALARQWRGLLILAGASIVEGVPALFSGRLVALAIDRGFAAGAPWVGASWLGLFAALTVLGALGSKLVYAGLGRVVEPLRDELVRAVVHGVVRGVPWREATGRHGPDASAVARITRHVEVVRDVTAGLLVYARAFVVTTVAALAGLRATAPDLVGLVAIPLLLALGLFAAVLPSLVARQRAVVLAEERTAESAGLVFAGVRDVVACGAQRSAQATVAECVDTQADVTLRLAGASALRTLIVALGGVVPLVLVLAASPALVHSGRLSNGAVVGAVTYLTTGVRPALRALVQTVGSSALRLVVTLSRLAQAASAVDPAAAVDPLAVGRPGNAVRLARPTGLDVTLRSVVFGWGTRAEPVLRGLDLHVPPGEHLAVVGPSGVGKSTLAGLLTGLITPQHGEVLLAGAPVSQIAPQRLRRLVALIPQEAYVFTGTVRENLAHLCRPIDDDALLAASEAVGAAELVRRLGGLQAKVGHGGAALSSGERQLVALARMYASPAGVVVLDEATCHLDPAAEARAEEAFAQRGGTVIVIAHRLSSALRADRVLVMDGDRPLLGRHEDLMTDCPLYAELMRAWAAPRTPSPGCLPGGG
jgi:ATP-binding cassette subfamily C protein